MASNYGVIAFIKPPQLNKVTQPALIRFETQYAAYKEKCNDVNRNRDEDNQITVASVKDCIESSTLHALCIMGEIQDAITVEEATVEKVNLWFENALSRSPRDLSERINAALASTSYTPCQEDPAGAVTSFVIEVIKALDHNNASSILNDSEKAKYLMNKMEQKFEPPLLRERIRMKRALWSSAEKSDIKFFRTQVASLATEVSDNEVARARLNVSKKRNRSDFEKKDDKPRKPRSFDMDKGRSTTPKTEHRSVLHSNKLQKQWTERCLNPKCGQTHMVKNCPITSPDLRKQLLDEYFQKKKAAKSVRTSDSDLPDASEGRYRVFLEDSIPAVALGDYGADFSAIPYNVLDDILEKDPALEVTVFDAPIGLRGAFKNVSIDCTASKSVKLCVTIQLPGPNIPLRIRGIEFYVVDTDMDGVLLGRPFLKSIGFNLEDHLENISAHVHDRDVAELDQSQLKFAMAKYKGLTYQAADDDPISLPEALAAGIGKDSKESINAAFHKILSNATKNGISEHGRHRLESLLERYRDIFRIKLGADPPAKVPALVITPNQDARPLRSPQRRYAPQQRDFIIQTIRELEAVGAIYKNPRARWASPALAVPKPGSTKLRFTVDLRGPNSQTIPIQPSMPHLESKFQDVAGSTCFANIDLAHGYWQVPLEERSQEFMSIQTPIGIYSSRRLLQGGSDSGTHFQAVLQEKFAGRVDKMIQWLDDFLFYAQNETELLDSLEAYFCVCEEVGIKIHAEKSNLFDKEVQFCGRIISSEGIQYHPRHFSSLMEMKKPTAADQLQQLLCATNWMRNSIPAYSETVAPLHALMEAAYSKAGKRTKQAVRKISITSSWGADHDAAFDTIKQQLAASVKLAHPKPDHRICLFTDASDTHWSAILTQVPMSQRHEDVDKQDHSPLCFLSGSFTGSASNWSVPEKEGFAIVEAMCRLDYLITGREVSIFTDHANLVYLYDPYGKNPGIARHTASKLMRWALKLSAFRYVIEHLPGEQNVWADMLTGWAVQAKATISSRTIGRLKSLLLAPISPGTDSRLDWPSLPDIISSQETANSKPPKRFKKTEEGWKDEKGIHWICSEDQMMKLRILVAAHTGMGGHRSWKVTQATLQSHFYWEHMPKDVEAFVRSCLHCLCTEAGTIIRRPLGHALHADLPNKMLHFDFCYMSKGEEGYCYVLVLKDDHSGYLWLTPAKEATAEVVSEVLIRWFASFGVVEHWVSDRGPHFKNELVDLLRETLKSSHHFTLAYCPWSNGTVEVVCRELLKATRALLSEFQLPQVCWPAVLPIVQSTLNNSILERLGSRCPLTAFTGLPQDSPLTAIKRKVGGVAEVQSVEEVRAKQRMNIGRLQTALDSMHKDVAIRTRRKRESAVKAHNRKTGVRPVNFTEGDFVLRGLLKREKGRKPSLLWIGPFRVVSCKSEYIFTVENLLNGKKQDVHGRRLKFFRNKDYNVTESLKEHLVYQEGEMLVIDRFEDIRRKDGEVQLLVKWKGFSDEEWDWVTLESLKLDVPVLAQEYIDDVSANGTSRQRAVVNSI